MAHKFDDLLDLTPAGGVDAKGPKEPNELWVELCAWVSQRPHPPGDEGAATEMTTKGGVLIGGQAGSARWEMSLGTVSRAALQAGPATALAITLMEVDGVQKVVQWEQHVTLV
jgi:hypothetical protein